MFTLLKSRLMFTTFCYTVFEIYMKTVRCIKPKRRLQNIILSEAATVEMFLIYL